MSVSILHRAIKCYCTQRQAALCSLLLFESTLPKSAQLRSRFLGFSLLASFDSYPTTKSATNPRTRAVLLPKTDSAFMASTLASALVSSTTRAVRQRRRPVAHRTSQPIEGMQSPAPDPLAAPVRLPRRPHRCSPSVADRSWPPVKVPTTSRPSHLAQGALFPYRLRG